MPENDKPENQEDQDPAKGPVQELPTDQNPPPPESEPGPEKFSFVRKQPWAVKIGSVLFLLFLLWLAIPKCSTPLLPPQKTYVIALDSSWYSLRLATRQTDLTIFFKVLLNAIAANQNLKIQVVERGPNLFQLLDRNECDGVISAFAPLGKDIDRYLSSDTIYQLGFSLVVKKNSLIVSPENVNGRIGIVGGAEVLMKIPPRASTSFFRYEDGSTALADLDNNVIDGVVMETLQANRFLQGLFAGRFKILYPPLINEGMELYLRKDKETENFLELFNKGLKELRESGQYRQLIEHWNVIYTGPNGTAQLLF